MPIVQIAASQSSTDTNYTKSLFALDDLGRVWERTWMQVDQCWGEWELLSLPAEVTDAVA